MKHNSLFCTICLVFSLTLANVWAWPPAPATQQQVNDGINNYLYLTPATLRALNPTNYPNLNAGGPTNGVTNNWTYRPGSSPLLLDAQAMDNQSSAGATWGALRRPQVWFYFNLGNGGSTNESNIRPAINFLLTNGIATNLQTLGVDTAINIDVGWQGSLRNTNWSYAMTNFGTLTWNTNRFVSFPEFIRYANTNRLKVTVQHYFATNIIPFGASSIISAYSGSYIQAWTNGNGTVPVDADGISYPITTTPDTVNQDLSTFYLWGLSGFTANDVSAGRSVSSFNQMGRMIGNASLGFFYGFGWNQNTPVTYFNQNLGVLDLGQPFNWVGRMPFKQWGMFTNQLAYFAYETTWLDYQTLGDITRQHHTGVYYENAGLDNQGNGVSGLENVYRDHPSAKFANEGAYVVWNNPDTVQKFSALVISHGVPIYNADNKIVSGSFTFKATWATNFYNPYLLAIWNDPRQEMPQPTFYGTNASSWMLKKANGDVVVAIYNKGAAATNLTFTVTNLGLPSSMTFNVRDCWSGAVVGSGGVWSTNMAGASVGSPSHCLLQFEPTIPSQAGSFNPTNGQVLTVVMMVTNNITITNGQFGTPVEPTNSTWFNRVVWLSAGVWNYEATFYWQNTNNGCGLNVYPKFLGSGTIFPNQYQIQRGTDTTFNQQGVTTSPVFDGSTTVYGTSFMSVTSLQGVTRFSGGIQVTTPGVFSIRFGQNTGNTSPVSAATNTLVLVGSNIKFWRAE